MQVVTDIAAGSCGRNLLRRLRALAVSPSLLLSLSLSACLACAGCNGSATANLIPILRSDLPPQEPLMQTVRADEAYYWVDDNGSLNIAMRHETHSLLGAVFDLTWNMSIVLDGLPAGSQRLYQLTSRDVRVVQSCGGDHRRYRSAAGVAVLEAPKGHQLEGRFHITVYQQQFGVLTGWTPSYHGPLLVLAGEFEAVENHTRGREILEQTEADGFGRPPLPTTRPTSRPNP